MLCWSQEHAQQPVMELSLAINVTRYECAVSSICSAQTATMCREFLSKSRQRDPIGPSTETDAPKQQPLLSAAAIRPLLLKASALLANVRPYHCKQCVQVEIRSYLGACSSNNTKASMSWLSRGADDVACGLVCWHQRKHLLVVKSARAKPLFGQLV